MQAITEQEWKIVRTFADCDMSITRTAERLFYARNTIKYHLSRIKKKTGYDPCTFYDLVRLVQMV